MFRIEKTLHKQVEVSDVETLLEGEEIRLYVLGYLREKVLDDEEISEMLEDYSDLKMTLSAEVTYNKLQSSNVRLDVVTQITVKKSYLPLESPPPLSGKSTPVTRLNGFTTTMVN